MLMSTYFLNHRDFSSKDGKQYHVLTVCDDGGEVSEFFHDSDMRVPDVSLFTPLDLEVSVSKYKGSTRLNLLRVELSSVPDFDR